MWILESDQDFLHGKRKWLKPGKKYLFGRVKKDGVRFAIDDKTVSRKHFVIAVDEVKEGDVGRIHARTVVTIIDQNSKSGTTVNGESLKGPSLLSCELRNPENFIRPGLCPHELIIRWQPCVLTLNLQKKELKTEALKTKQDRVRGLDVKAISEFVPDRTTHVVVNKRNTPKGLQALIKGKYLVTEAFIDALEYATTPANLDEEENLSPLEADFDAAWPQPKEHLPQPGREPNIRPAKLYEPSADRSNIFKDFTFVFGDQTQYDNLLPVISSGHGKALLFKVIDGVTSVDEAIQYMQNAAGDKGLGQLHDRAQRVGTIMVRWSPKDNFAEWASNLINQVALKIDQRAIDQAELLDTILLNDPTLLRQPIPNESITDGQEAPSSSATPSFPSVRQPLNTQPQGDSSANPLAGVSEQPSSSSTEPHPTDVNGILEPSHKSSQLQPKAGRDTPTDAATSEPGDKPSLLTQRARLRMALPSAPKEFDDGFDPDAIVPYDSGEEEENSVSASQLDNESELPPLTGEPPCTAKKRHRNSSPRGTVDSFAEDMDDLLPAATAYKRRKIASETEAIRNGLPLTASTKPTFAPVKKTKAAKKEIDVRKIVRAQREKEDAEERKEREDLAEGLPYENDDNGPANLVVVVQLELPVREIRPKTTGRNPEDDPRWDAKWNGRKNFKRFCPQSDTTAGRIDHSAKGSVPLVEVKKNTGGLGEKYWEQSEKSKQREKKRKAKGQLTQSQSQNPDQGRSVRLATGADEGVEADDESDFGDSEKQISPEAARLQQEAAEILEQPIDPDSPRRTRGDDARSQTQSSKPQTQTQGKKRPVPKDGAGVNSNKKQKTLPVTEVRGSDDEDDSDDMKFRFGSRGRLGKGKA